MAVAARARRQVSRGFMPRLWKSDHSADIHEDASPAPTAARLKCTMMRRARSAGGRDEALLTAVVDDHPP